MITQADVNAAAAESDAAEAAYNNASPTGKASAMQAWRDAYDRYVKTLANCPTCHPPTDPPSPPPPTA